MQIIVEETIRAPRTITFANAADVLNWPSMISAIQSTEILTREPIVAGTRFRETRKMYGQVSSEEMTFSEFEPPDHFVLSAESHGTQYRIAHKFADVADGTKLTLTFQAEPATLTAQLLTPLAMMFRASLRRQLTSDLADLKRAIETRER